MINDIFSVEKNDDFPSLTIKAGLWSTLFDANGNFNTQKSDIGDICIAAHTQSEKPKTLAGEETEMYYSDGSLIVNTGHGPMFISNKPGPLYKPLVGMGYSHTPVYSDILKLGEDSKAGLFSLAAANSENATSSIIEFNDSFCEMITEYDSYQAYKYKATYNMTPFYAENYYPGMTLEFSTKYDDTWNTSSSLYFDEWSVNLYAQETIDRETVSSNFYVSPYNISVIAKEFTVSSDCQITKSIYSVSTDSQWWNGRDHAMIKMKTPSKSGGGGYTILSSLGTHSGSWEIGQYNPSSSSDWYDKLIFTFFDTNDYNNNSLPENRRPEGWSLKNNPGVQISFSKNGDIESSNGGLILNNGDITSSTGNLILNNGDITLKTGKIYLEDILDNTTTPSSYKIGGQILKTSTAKSSWWNGRDNAMIRLDNIQGGYYPIVSGQAKAGSWQMGTCPAEQSHSNKLIFTYVTNEGYANQSNIFNNKEVYTHIKFSEEGVVESTALQSRYYGTGNAEDADLISNLLPGTIYFKIIE